MHTMAYIHTCTFVLIFKRKKRHRIYYTQTHTHSHTLKPSGSAIETMQETEGIETVSLLESCNLFSEGHILCSARERASNTAFLLMPQGFVYVYLCVCCHSLRACEKRGWQRGGNREMMMNWQRNAVPCKLGQEEKGGQRTMVSHEDCLRRQGPVSRGHVEWTLWHVLTSLAPSADLACFQNSNLLTVLVRS